MDGGRSFCIEEGLRNGWSMKEKGAGSVNS